MHVYKWPINCTRTRTYKKYIKNRGFLIWAQVPIVKMVDARTQTEVDLCFNNMLGVENTRLLKAYCGYGWFVQPLALTIKYQLVPNSVYDARAK